VPTAPAAGNRPSAGHDDTDETTTTTQYHEQPATIVAAGAFEFAR